MINFLCQAAHQGNSLPLSKCNKKLFSNSYVRIAFLLALNLFIFRADFAFADDALMARIDKIHTLSDRDTAEGIRQLTELKEQIPADASAQSKLELLRILSGLYYDSGRNKLADEMLAEYKKLAQQLNDKDALLRISIFESYTIYEKSGNQAAFDHLEKLRNAVSQSNSREIQFQYISIIASHYRSAGRFEEALKYYLSMLKQADQLPRRKLQEKMWTWEAITEIHLSMKDPESALQATTEALAESVENEMPKHFLHISMSRGQALSFLKRNAEAIKEFEKALRIAEKEKFPSEVAFALTNLADQNLILKNYKRAEQFARQSISKATVLEDEWVMNSAKINLGLALGWQGKIKQATEILNECVAYFRKYDAKSALQEIDSEVAAMYENAGMHKEALAFVHEQVKLSDELFKSSRAKALATLQEEFEAENRKKKIEILEKNNALKDIQIKNHRLQQIVAFLASLVALLAGGISYKLYRRSKKLNERLQEVNTQLEFQVVRDPLTGLHNRRSFIMLMSGRSAHVNIERRESAQSSPDCMILLDIDHFKHINDTWGHMVGDNVLKEVATRLRQVVREEDMLMRWGGEEFLIFSPKSNLEQITNLVDRVMRVIGGKPIMHESTAIPVTVTAGFISIPFSGVPEDVCDWERALQIADMALYLGKTHGRNRAYGIARLRVPHEEAITVLSHDLAAAILKNMVEVVEVVGPIQNSRSTTGESPSSRL